MSMGAPILIGVTAIPLLIQGMGKERFGLLSIIWMGVGYFSLFDMGLGRALTKLVAEHLRHEAKDELGRLIWTALWLILSLGLLGALTIFLGAGPLVRNIFHVQPQLQKEAEVAFLVLGTGLPFVILTAALRGLLEAHQRFDLIAIIRVPLGILTFLGPLGTLHFSPSLVWATSAMLGGRIIATFIYLLFAVSLQKELVVPKAPSVQDAKLLVNFGGWLSVTNIVGPLMVYFDRFLLGSVQTMTAVTYYVTPYEVLSRLSMLPGAVMGVIFPAMSTAQAADKTRMLYLYERTSRVLVVLMVPPVSLFFLFAPEALHFWLGPDFARHSTPVVQWLAIGWLVNVMAHTPFTALQALNRPDLVAKTHLAEVIPYFALLWILTNQFGIAGTACAWFLRVCADTVILNTLAQRIMPELTGVVRRTYLELLILLIMALVVFVFADALSQRVLVFFLSLAAVALPAVRLGKNFFKKS